MSTPNGSGSSPNTPAPAAASSGGATPGTRLARPARPTGIPEAPQEDQAVGRFGTFGGVFTPCVLTILGVIMFMRFGFVTGHSGLWAGLALLILAKTITTLTTLSLSAIATNTDVRVGGVYFMISRVLGPDFGGSIGITLFFAQAVSVAFYTIGFTEAVFNLLVPFLSEDTALTLYAMRVPQLVSTVTIVGLFALTFRGAGVAIKAQYAVFGILTLSVLAIIIGGFVNFQGATLRANAGPAFTNDMGFWALFALFFPAATGITAGANMSGDLRNPGRAIPKGTLIAIGVTLAVYGVEIVLLAGGARRDDLIRNSFGTLQSLSLFAPIVVAGVFAATLSSALGSFLGAPRILQALGQDGILRPLVFFGKGAGEAREPRRATVLTFVIALLVIWAGDLNAVAEVITMFFLIAYGMINLSAFVESKGANPSFRPRFRAFHWSTALLGAIGCLVAMLKINETYAMISFAIVGSLYFYLKKRDIQATFGDAKRGFLFSRTRENLFQLQRSRWHPKNWRPTLVSISRDPLAEDNLIQVGAWLEAQRGLYTVAQIEEAPEMNLDARLAFRHQRQRELGNALESLDITALADVTVVSDFHEGLATFLQSYSLWGLRPNTVLLTLPPASNEKARADFLATVEVLRPFNFNLLFLKSSQMAVQKKQRTVDLWWRGEGNGSLMALLAHLMTGSSRVWSDAKVRIFRAETNPQAEKRVREKLAVLLEQARIQAEVNVLHTTEAPFSLIPSRSASEADIIMLGVTAEDMRVFPRYLKAMDGLLDQLPTALLIHANGEADLFA